MKYILIVFVLVCKGVWSDVADGKGKETKEPLNGVIINNTTETSDIPITVITTPNGTTPNVTTPTTSAAPTTSKSTTTVKPPTPTTPSTTTKPAPPTPPPSPTPPTPTNKTTKAPVTTPTPAPVTTTPPHKDRRFDGPSFIGGIILASGLMAVGFVAFKFYKARTERNYHTL